MRQYVADQVEHLAAAMRLGDGLAELVQAAELVVAHTQAVARLAGIDGIGAESEGVAHHRQRTGGGEQLGGMANWRLRHGAFRRNG